MRAPAPGPGDRAYNPVGRVPHLALALLLEKLNGWPVPICTMRPSKSEPLLRRIRWMVGLVILGLVLSGLSAIPLVWQLELAQQIVGPGGNAVEDW
jgi:hypothetical protein